MKGRNLVVMFDGTWHSQDNHSNVSRMSRAIDKVDEGTLARKEARDGDQLVHYIEGLGTGATGKLTGGAFGYGLSEKIRKGYSWLSEHYQPHDQIFVFGFSRGAFTARALVSLVHKCGGLLKTNDDADRAKLTKEAYKLYSEVVTEKEYFPKYLERLKQFGSRNCRQVRVKMIGVWDTVGALFIPYSFLMPEPAWWNWAPRVFLKRVRQVMPASWTREYYRFHIQSLPCIVDEAYHALAIDEHRLEFVPRIWDSRKKLDPADQNDHLIVPKEQKVKQCWFAGSHGNVGGGIDEDPEAPWKLSYEWMHGKAEKAGLRFRTFHKSNSENWKWQGKLEDTYANFAYGIYSKFIKPINRAIIRETVPTMKMEGSRAEKLHRSVKLRMEKNPRYRPLALECRENEFGPAYDSATNKDDLNKETALGKGKKKYHTVIPFDPMVPKKCTCKLTPREAKDSFIAPYPDWEIPYRYPLILEKRLASGDGKS